MLKTLTLSFLIVLSVFQISSATTCSSNPVLSKIKNYIDLVDPTSQLTTVRAKITEFETTMTASTQTGLGACAQFDGQNTCCTADFVTTVVNGLSKQFFQAKKTKQPTKLKMMDKLGKAIEKCSGKGGQPTDMGSEAAGFEKGKKAAFGIKQCQAKALKAKVKFDRGNLCALCVDPTKYAEYFSGDSLIVKEESLNKYKTAAAAGLKCFDDMDTEYKEMVDEAIDKFGDKGKCAQLKTKIEEVLGNVNNKACGSSTCDNQVNEQMQAFGEGIQRKIEGTDPDIDTAALRRNLKRMLDTGITTSTTTGLVTYISDTDDDELNIDGVDEDSTYDDDGNASRTLQTSIFGIALLLLIIY